MRATTILTAVLACAPLSASAGDLNLREDAGAAVDELLQGAALSGKKVAVGGFSNEDGKLTGLSAQLAEDFELALVQRAPKKGFQVMDRRNVAELAREWELSVNGSVDDEHLVRAGNLLGAEVLCIGRYTRSGKTVSLRATLVDAEKGAILAAYTRELKLSGSQRDLAEKILPDETARPAPAKGAGEPLKVELATDKPQYAVGDKFSVSVKANRDCYLTVIDVGADNKATVIFPNVYAPSNAVKAGVTYRIPDPSAGFEFEVAPPAGTEIIRAIASKEPSVDLADVMKKPTADAPFAEVKTELPVLTRAIHVKAKKAKPGDWSEDVLKLTIR